jgi:hypothetical protein
MELEEGPGRNLFSEIVSSRKALKLPVENFSTEISRGTLSSHPESRWKNLCFSLFFNIFSFRQGRWPLKFPMLFVRRGWGGLFDRDCARCT